MEFQFQDPGEGIHEAEIRDVLVSAGDEVKEGQDVIVVETDKAAFELASPHSGRIEEVVVSQGDIVHVGDALIRFASASDDEASTSDQADESDESDESDAAIAQEASDDRKKQSSKKRASTGTAQSARGEASAEAKRSDGGKASAETKQPSEDEASAEASDGDRPDTGRGDRPRRPVPATPATRRLARELGVDLHQVPASGDDGRVTADDVRQASDRPASDRPASDRQEAAGTGGELPDFSKWGPVERTPLRSVRRKIAEHMARSWERIPHVTHHDQLDITELERLRKRIAPHIEEQGVKLTLTALLAKALVGLLKDYPRMNASLDAEAEEIIVKRYYNFGIATDTDRGLLVPVVHGVDSLSLRELCHRMQEVSSRARAGKASRGDLTGGTFTITNVGSIGGRTFTPIINHPEVAILGVGRARLESVVDGTLDEYAMRVRLVLPVSLAFDHRVLDGAESARFVNDLQKRVADADGFVTAL